MTCSACTTAETSVLTHKEHREGCLSCSARAIARTYGEYPADLANGVMTRLWTDTKTFRAGRSSYWAWVRIISEAKEKT